MDDAFQVRVDFAKELRRLNASQQSIHKVLAFADTYALKLSGDLWETLLTECNKVGHSSRLNILFLLDFLFTDYSSSSSNTNQSAARATLLANFRSLAQRDLAALIDAVVPSDSWQGVKLNSAVTIQVLSSWRLKRVFPQEQIAEVLETIEQRKHRAAEEHRNAADDGGESNGLSLTKDEVMRRIEEDRERHKRIREKLWVLPPKSYIDAATSSSSIASSSSSAAKKQRLDAPGATIDSSSSAAPLADVLDIQFEELWETTSDLNDDDLLSWKEEEEERWWASEKLVRRRKQEKEEQAAAAARLQEELRKKEEEERRKKEEEAAAKAAAAEAEARRLEREERQARWSRANAAAGAGSGAGSSSSGSGSDSRWHQRERDRDRDRDRDRGQPPPSAPSSSGGDARWPSRPPPPGPPPRAPAAAAAAAAAAAQAPSTPVTGWGRRPPVYPGSSSSASSTPTGPGRRRWG